MNKQEQTFEKPAPAFLIHYLNTVVQLSVAVKASIVVSSRHLRWCSAAF